MKIKHLFIASLAALAVTACSKTDNEGIDTAEKSVTIKIGDEPVTSAVADSLVVDGQKSYINNINVYFLRGDVVTNSFYLPSGPDLAAIKSAAGFKFTGINGSASEVYIVANYNSDQSGLTGPQTLTAVKALTLTMDSQNTSTGTKAPWRDVLMSNNPSVAGNGQINGAGNASTATVEIAPVVARIEIAKISVNPATLISFDLDGIYINGFYKTVSVDRKGGTFTLNSVVTDYDAANAATRFGKYGDLKSGAALVQNPGANKCFGYQLAPTATGEMPWIVLKCSNVKAFGQSVANPATQFITIKKYKVGVADQTSFVANTVYNIANIELNAGDFTDVPGEDKKDVTVNVTVTKWSIVNLTPQIN